jgi:DNA repair exonuclease SbcCD ATPase subunit
MVQELIQKAQTLPEEVERLILELHETKQRLHTLLEDRQRLEAAIAGEVAGEVDGNGKKKYPNEEARKAEIAKRLEASEIWQVNEEAIREAREQVVNLEAQLDRARYEHRTATTLLNLFAAAIQSNRQDVAELITGNNNNRRGERQPKQAKPSPEAASNGSTNGSKDAKETLMVVLEVDRTQNGNLKATCLDVEANKEVVVYAKGEAAKRLEGSLHHRAKVTYKQLDRGLYALKVS